MVYLPSVLKSIAIAGALSFGVVPLALAVPEKTATLQQGEAIAQAGIPDADVVTVASSISDFTTLVQAIRTAGLVDTLQGPGPFTVFAPTNEAFADLDGLLRSRYGLSVADLLQPENQDLLTEVLTHHVVPGAAIASGDIPNGVTVLEAADGSTLQVNRGGEDINVNSVGLSAFDVPATNGVIHVVEHVLLPPEVVAALEESRTETAQTTTTTTESTAPAAPAQTTTPAQTTESAEPVRGLW